MSVQVTWESLTSQFAKLLKAGHRYVVLIANPLDGQGISPFTQVSWRDDCRMQLEAVSDTFLDHELDAGQCTMLRQLGFATPHSLGDDYLNWVQFRNGEGAEPLLVARFLVECLRDVYRVRIDDVDFEWIASEEMFQPPATVMKNGTTYLQNTAGLGG